MSDWDGIERRTGAVTRGEFEELSRYAEVQRKELRDIMREIKSSLVDTKRSLQCVHETWQAHLAEYGDVLKELKNVSITRSKLRMAVAEKSIVALVWAMLLIVGYALWDYIKERLH